MDIWSTVRSFAGFYWRVALSHLLTYVLIGGASYMLIMRHVWVNFPADLHLRDITSLHVQTWLWPVQLVRALVLAVVFYPLRETLLGMGRYGGLMVAAILIGIGWLAGFTGLFESLIFYRNVSPYLHWVHIPEVTVQTVCFGYLLLSWERSAAQRAIGVPSLISRAG